MATLFDYLDWRGDIELSVDGFNEVDNIILCQLSYIDFSNIVPSDFKSTVTLKEVSIADFSKQMPYDPRMLTLLKKAGASRRFGNARLCGYVDYLDKEKEMQFSAVTFLYDKHKAFIAFRGTDITITGWKEDFNMVYMAPVPSQKESVFYLENAFRQLTRYGLHKKSIILGGHSKGGNLATYSAAFSTPRFLSKISCIYCNDSPGFDSSLFSEDVFDSVNPLIKTYLPQDSVIGQLLEHKNKFTVIKSTASGLMQHDPFSWEVYRNSFIHLPELTKTSIRFEKTIKRWLFGVELKDRKRFVDIFFNTLEQSGIKTWDDLQNINLPRTLALIKQLTALKPQERDTLIKIIYEFVEILVKNEE